jgi:hypothetical protein
MKKLILAAALLGTTMLGGCVVYPYGGYGDPYYGGGGAYYSGSFYYDGRRDYRHRRRW